MHWALCRNGFSRAQYSALLSSQILDNDTCFQGISHWLEDESIVFPFSLPSLWVIDSEIQHFSWIIVNSIGDIRLNVAPASKPSGASSVMPGGPLQHLPSFTDGNHHHWDEVQTPGSAICGAARALFLPVSPSTSHSPDSTGLLGPQKPPAGLESPVSFSFCALAHVPLPGTVPHPLLAGLSQHPLIFSSRAAFMVDVASRTTGRGNRHGLCCNQWYRWPVQFPIPPSFQSLPSGDF